MEAPKTQHRFCPYCRKHTEHSVKRVSSAKKRRMLAHGQRIFKRKMKGYGSFPRSKPDFSKDTKKVDLRYKCKECGKEHNVGKGFRVKKYEITK